MQQMEIMSSILFACAVLGFVHSAPANDNGYSELLKKNRVGNKTLDVQMPGVTPKTEDFYVCTSVPVPAGENYIVQFEPLASGDTAHHMLMFGCKEPAEYKKSWECGQTCKGKPNILFAWAKNAPPTNLPDDVGFKIGGNSEVKYIVLQIHYKNPAKEPDSSGVRLHYTPERQKNIAGIALLLAAQINIPPHTPEVLTDVSCQFSSKTPIYPFGFRTHAHSLSTVITGYHYNGSYHLIGKGNPQWPQAFYPVKDKIRIRNNDILMARCVYDSTNKDTYVGAGPTHNDEMCNFYIMYYTDANGGQPFYECFGNWRQGLFLNSNFPKEESKTPLPPNPALEEEAEHGHKETSGIDPESEDTKLNKGEELTPGNRELLEELFGLDQLRSDRLVAQKKSGYYGNKGYNGGGGRYSRYGYTDTSGHQDHLSNSNRGYFDYLDLPNGNMARDDEDYYLGMEKQRNWGHVPAKPNLKPYHDSWSDEGSLENSVERERVPQRPQSAYHHTTNSLNKVIPPPTNHQAAATKSMPQSTEQYKLPKVQEEFIAKSPEKIDPEEKQHSYRADINKEFTGLPEVSTLGAVANWPDVGGIKLGQVAGVDTDSEGNVHIFHRADRDWDFNTFDPVTNQYQQKQRGPITENTILTFNPSGKLIKQWGKNMFYLPHGLSIDDKDNIWVTDVAMHQVFKFNKGEEKPSLTLGKAFEPGNDKQHFCKPTDVAILPTGEFFVSDGYCNHRILKYAADGTVMKSWGDIDGDIAADGYPVPGAFKLPHGLTLVEDRKLLCVADRENGRIQCFDYEGNFKFQIHLSEFGHKVYAMAYTPHNGGVLYAINADQEDQGDNEGFTIKIDSGKLESTWKPQGGFSRPHDVAVSKDGKCVYVAEIGTNRVWKFHPSFDAQIQGIKSAMKAKTTYGMMGNYPNTIKNNMQPYETTATRTNFVTNPAFFSTRPAFNQFMNTRPAYTPFAGPPTFNTRPQYLQPGYTQPIQTAPIYNRPVNIQPAYNQPEPVGTYVNKQPENSLNNIQHVYNQPKPVATYDNKQPENSPNDNIQPVTMKPDETEFNEASKTTLPVGIHKSQKKMGEGVYKRPSNIDKPDVTSDEDDDEGNVKKSEISKEVESNSESSGQGENNTTPIIVGVVLIVPVVVVVVATIAMRIRRRMANDRFYSADGGSRGVFNLGNILGRKHKGFQQLNTEELDHLNSDSEDEFSRKT